MEKKNFLRISVLLLVFLVLSVSAYAGSVTLSSDVTNVCLPEKDSFGIELRISNGTNETKCYDFDVDSGPFIDASIAPNESVCVNKNENRTMTLTINTWDAGEEEYDLNVFAVNDPNIFLQVKLNVGDCEDGNFDLAWTSRNLCRGNVETIRATVENNSDISRVFKLSAENGFMLPYFSKETIIVPANGEKDVDLVVNAAFAPLGRATIFLRAASGNEQIEKIWKPLVVDCSQYVKKEFFLEVPAGCFNVQKGKEFNGSFNVRRVSQDCPEDSRKQIFFSLSGIDNNLFASSAWFGCGQSRRVDFTVRVPSDAAVGKMNIVARAYDAASSENKNICLNVLGAGNVDIFVKEDYKSIVRGFPGTIAFEVSNKGDFNETVFLSLLNVPNSTIAGLSDSNFSLLSGSSRTVYITVTPSLEVFLGIHSVKLSMSKPVSKTIDVHFNVIDRASLEELEVLSYTQEISLQGLGSGRYNMILRNNSAATLRNISVSFENVPRDINIDGATVSGLPSGNEIWVSGAISVGDINGNFPVTAVVKSGSISVTKNILLLVSPSAQAQNQGTNILSGLFNLGFLGGDPGMVAGIFAALLLVLIIIVGVALFLRTQVYASDEPFLVLSGKSAATGAEKSQVWVAK